MPYGDGTGPEGKGPRSGRRGRGVCRQVEMDDDGIYNDEGFYEEDVDERMFLASGSSLVCQNWEKIWASFTRNSKFKTSFRKSRPPWDECWMDTETKFPLIAVNFDVSYKYYEDGSEFEIIAFGDDMTTDELEEMLADAFPGLGLKKQAAQMDETHLKVSVYDETQFLKALQKVAWGAAGRIADWLDYGGQAKYASPNESRIREFLLSTKGPIKDSEVHAMADELGIDHDDLESEIYGLLREKLQKDGREKTASVMDYAYFK